MTSSYVSENTLIYIETYWKNIQAATNELIIRWKSTQYYMSLPQAAIHVLFFRNCCIWDSIDHLVRVKKLHGADILIRPLLEGVIIFEWCSIDLDSRAFRFRLSSFSRTLDHLKAKKHKNSIERINQLQEAIADLKKRKISELPKVKQMMDDLEQSGLYAIYKHLSEKSHGVYEEWGDYQYYLNNMNSSQSDQVDLWKHSQALALSSFLQMRNIKCMGFVFEPLAYKNMNDLEVLWKRIFISSLEDRMK